MSWYKDCRKILSREPEEWLAYIYGQQLESIPYLTGRSIKLKGTLTRSAVFIMKLLRGLGSQRTIKKLCESPPCILFFAGSKNQYGSIDSTLEALKLKRSSSALLVTPKLKKLLGEESNCAVCQYSLGDIGKAVLLFLCMAPSLYFRVKRKHLSATKLYFDSFCESYIWLIFFHRVFGEMRPDFVVVTNDHNVVNRCLIAVAHHYEIKTIYMQHASVSTIFPALRVNYAFLDGRSAYETYRKCEGNFPANNITAPFPEIFLTGQKKKLPNVKNSHRNMIGVAVNVLDDPYKMIDLVSKLVDHDFNVYFRWHPAQKYSDLALYKSGLEMLGVTVSDPEKEHISVFLGKLKVLFAGNSSIHLEAAIMGVQTLYYETSGSANSDYYGYVQSGLSRQITDLTSLAEIIESHDKSRADAVGFFSATYGTSWQDREGELVAECLACLAGEREDKFYSKWKVPLSGFER